MVLGNVTVTAAFSVPYFIKGYPVHSSLHNLHNTLMSPLQQLLKTFPFYHDVTQSMCLHMSWTCYDALVCMSAKQVKPCISIHEKVYEAKWHYIGEEGK